MEPVHEVHRQKMNIKVKSSAKAYAFGAININAPLEKVYSLISNINYWPDWLKGVTKVTISGEIEEGTEFEWKANGFKIKSRLHTVLLNSAIGWTGKMLWIKAVHNWYFEKTDEGITHVVVEENLTGFGSALMKNTLKDGITRDLIDLKNEAEKI